jgi:hypothetical protein
MLYSRKVFQHGFRTIAVSPANIEALIWRKAHPAMPGENSMHQPRDRGQVLEDKAGRAFSRKFLFHWMRTVHTDIFILPPLM